MTWIHSIHSMLPRPERRSEPEIEDDLDAEFAFHLEQSTREFIETGHDQHAARGLAHFRFGDVTQIKRQCKRIALEERIMLQRVNFVMMLVVMLMVVGVGIQVVGSSRVDLQACKLEYSIVSPK